MRRLAAVGTQETPEHQCDRGGGYPEQPVVEAEIHEMQDRQHDRCGERQVEPAPLVVGQGSGKREREAEHHRQQGSPPELNRKAVPQRAERWPCQGWRFAPGIDRQGEGMEQQDKVGQGARTMMPSIHALQTPHPFRQPGFTDHEQKADEQQPPAEPAADDGNAAPECEVFRESPEYRQPDEDDGSERECEVASG